MRFWRRLAPACAVALLPSCGRETSSVAHGIRFTDATAQSGIAFVTTSGETPSTQILEVKGGGVALIDHDEDGDLDVFVPNGATMADPEHGPGCRLFENLGALRFRDATVAGPADSSVVSPAPWSERGSRLNQKKP